LALIDGRFSVDLRPVWRNLESANLNLDFLDVQISIFRKPIALYHLYETYDLCETTALCVDRPSVKPIWARSLAL
jgi:hypothetical protein